MNKLIFASCLALSFLSSNGLAQSDKAKQIDELMKPFAAAQQFSGVVLAMEDGVGELSVSLDGI